MDRQLALPRHDAGQVADLRSIETAIATLEPFRAWLRTWDNLDARPGVETVRGDRTPLGTFLREAFPRLARPDGLLWSVAIPVDTLAPTLLLWGTTLALPEWYGTLLHLGDGATVAELREALGDYHQPVTW